MVKRSNLLSKRRHTLFQIINIIFMSCLITVTILPLLHTLSLSLSSDMASMEPGLKLWPSQFSMNGYKQLFSQVKIGIPLMNSIYTTLVGTALHVFFSSLTAYVLCRGCFPGKKAFITMLLITMAVPIQNIMIPTYMLYRNLGLLDTFVPIIISSMVTAFAVMLLKSFFAEIPDSLWESAKIDGAGEMRILWSIYAPLALPGIATITLYQLVGKWNILLEPVLFISDPRENTLQVALKSLVINSDASSSATLIMKNTQMAGVIIAIAPLVIMHPFLQKFFIGQLTSGATKG